MVIRKSGAAVVMLLFSILSFLAMLPTFSCSSPPFRTNESPKHSYSPNSFILCRRSPSATLDLLIFVLVTLSSLFLIASALSHLFNSFCLILPSSFAVICLPLSVIFFAFFVSSFFIFHLGFRSRKCGKPNCKGLKKATELDIQLQTENCLRSAAATEIDNLPCQGGVEGNPDYECLRVELRRIAPPNGKAVLLFRSRCGCPVAKLEAWSSKRGRRHRKGMRALELRVQPKS